MPKRWNFVRATLMGFLCGMVVSVFRKLLEGDGASFDPAYLVGLALGGGIAGALLFGVFVLIRNAFAK
jgi:ammonia channel protein AmtB